MKKQRKKLSLDRETVKDLGKSSNMFRIGGGTNSNADLCEENSVDACDTVVCVSGFCTNVACTDGCQSGFGCTLC